jgi:DNA-binding CsgD family transcriptional regulator
MLLGRQAECGRLDRLLADARAGHSGVLLIRGEAGIGKSALLDYARQQAADLNVLRCRGVESESELAFSALADVFRPVLNRLSSIPEPQADALAAALALGPPGGGARFAACAATLSLLAAAAEESPLLVTIDDAQWLDPSSAEALLFAARRLDAEGIVLLFAARTGEAPMLERAHLPQLVLSGLDREAAAALLAGRNGPVAPPVVDRLLAATAGNPLALLEIPSLLSAAQLAGTEPLGDELPTAPAVEQAFLRHVEELPERSQEALLVAAASESGDPVEIAQALLALGLDPRELDAAEEAGLLSVAAGRLAFRHPLLRAAVYHVASTGARQAAHRALAQTAAGELHAARRAWHLAAAAPAHDEAAASALEEAAVEARRRGGRAEAASAFERAALLSPDESEKARLLHEAAHDAWLAGGPDKALELLDAALACARDPVTRARIQHLRAGIELWGGSPMSAQALLSEEATAIEDLEPARAARMLTDAAWACFVNAEIDAGVETAERACALAERAGVDAETLAKAVLGIGLVLSGEPRKAMPLFAGYVALLENPETETAIDKAFRPDGQVLTWFEQYERARQSLTRTIESARRQTALGVLSYPLAVLSDLDFRTGNWAAAYAGASEAVRIADETEQETMVAFSLGCLARIEAARGDEDDCRRHAQRALALAYGRIGAVVASASAALGLLELGLGRPDEAIVHLEEIARLAAAHGLREPAVVQWAPDLVEAFVRAGREDDAARELASFARLANETERTWALATTSRCRGLLAPDDAFEAEFEQALELHGRTSAPFELARTQLCLGERLRRARKRAEAREPLRSALETFERLGATPWAERSRVELAATGETARRRDPYAAEQLTPQELQVALIVAQGATNKEAGAALFLSPKTIETHLGRVYRKLGVRSRTELAHLLASEGALEGAAA